MTLIVDYLISKHTLKNALRGIVGYRHPMYPWMFCRTVKRMSKTGSPILIRAIYEAPTEMVTSLPYRWPA